MAEQSEHCLLLHTLLLSVVMNEDAAESQGSGCMLFAGSCSLQLLSSASLTATVSLCLALSSHSCTISMEHRWLACGRTAAPDCSW